MLDFEKLLSIFFENFPYLIIWINLNGNIVQCNVAIEKIIGYSTEDLKNIDFIEIITYPKDKFLFKEMCEILLEGKFVEFIEIQANKKRGKFNLVELSILFNSV
ncbi:MAG: PAS domain S-box protein [Promethearchaeota archaeon]